MPRLLVFTGEKGSGKSTAFLRHYRTEPCGRAVFSEKVTDECGRIGYNLILLPEGRRICPFARMDAVAPGGVGELRHGRFHFAESAFSEAIRYLSEEMDAPVWMDEVGKIEFSGRGFAPLLTQCLQRKQDLILVVRLRYLHELWDTFDFTDYTIEIHDVSSSEF